MYLFEELKFDCNEKKDMSLFGAFPGSGSVDFYLQIQNQALPEICLVRSVKMVIHADGWNTQQTEYRSFTLGEMPDLDEERRVFHIRIDFPSLLHAFQLKGEGLFYYHYAVTFSDGDSSDKVVYLGGEEPTALQPLENFVGERQLLVYCGEYETSSVFTEGVIYHIFVDRFASSKRYPVKERAELDPNWEFGIPQYGAYPGAEVANNVFFGGDLTGIEEKMGYIESLGVKTIYLSPVFEAYSNHKYDTADYLTVDSMFGGDDALASLCETAAEYGIRVILDGVFNHTGADSVYFNKYGTYDTVGAYQSVESPYYPWYSFKKHPDEYESWWGVQILPRIHSGLEDVRRFICNSVVPKWMQAGVSGWRLDVADELAEEFLDDFRSAVKAQNKDAVVIGEVWEDASDKVAYGRRRRYFGGRQLDSVMNYPIRSALIEYVQKGECAPLRRFTEGTYRRYPKQSSDNLMNFLGTHDTERILTLLGGAEAGDKSNDELAKLHMSAEERANAITKLKLAYGILAGLPGVPCVFYGDEAGLEGYRDPFCRRPFPWKHIEIELLSYYQKIGMLRREQKVFRDGLFRIISLTPEHIIYVREPFSSSENCGSILVAACRSGELKLQLPEKATALIGTNSNDVTLRTGEVGYYLFFGETKLTAEQLNIR